MNPLFTIDEFNALVEKLAQSADDLSARFGQVRTLDTQARLATPFTLPLFGEG